MKQQHQNGGSALQETIPPYDPPYDQPKLGLADYQPSLNYEDYLESIDKYAMLNLDDWLLLTNDSFIPTSAIANISVENIVTDIDFQNDIARVRKSFSTTKYQRSASHSTVMSDSNVNSDDDDILADNEISSIPDILSAPIRTKSRLKSKYQEFVTLPAAFSVDPHNGTVFVMLVRPLDINDVHDDCSQICIMLGMTFCNLILLFFIIRCTV